MATAADDSKPPLSPNGAFALLGNETRMEILQVLGDTDQPMAFSDLREQVGVSDSGRFNYHLDQLVGHFVRDSENGYVLHRAGERVIEAVLSGAVTENPVIEPTRTDQPCPHCDASVKISYRGEWLALSCTECSGTYEESPGNEANVPDEMLDHGYLGGLALPPAGIQGREAMEVLRAAEVWGTLETLAAAEEICPRCSASMETSVAVCENHDTSDGLCGNCGFRSSVSLETSCTNCPNTTHGAFAIHLASNTDLIAFQTTRGFNPLKPGDLFAAAKVDQEILSTDPFRARFTFTIDEDSITLTVDDELQVVNVQEEAISGTDR